MMKRFPTCAAALLIFLSGLTQCSADLILTFDNTQFTFPERNGSINVFAAATPGSSEEMAFYSVLFRITKESGDGNLVFDQTQSSSELLDPNYAFANASDRGDNFLSARQLNANELVHNDFTVDTAPILGNTPVLIGSLNFNLIFPSGEPYAGGVFRIQAIQGDNTFFSDSTFDFDNPTPIAPSSFSNLGQITINASGVPEPSGLAVVAAAGLTGLMLRRRRSTSDPNGAL